MNTFSWWGNSMNTTGASLKNGRVFFFHWEKPLRMTSPAKIVNVGMRSSHTSACRRGPYRKSALECVLDISRWGRSIYLQIDLKSAGIRTGLNS